MGGRLLDARKHFGYSVSALEARAMKKSLTPRTDKIARDLIRVVADVLDFGYPESGTNVAGRYMEARKTKKWIKIRVGNARN